MVAKPEEPSLPVRFISLLWGVIFVGSGLLKVVMLPEQEQMFRSFGFPEWPLPVVGVVEIIFGALILNPRWRPWGALLLALEMAGVAVLHILTGVMAEMVLINAALFTGATYVLFKERHALLHPPRRFAR
jgi:uncharacterized membrane protein YphA (DoxX/SURF4 family)